MTNLDLLAPLKNIKFVPRETLKPNNYNPNVVSKDNLKLLTQSILANGFTMPIMIRPDNTIIDGFHRYTVAGQEPLKSKLGGLVPVVVIRHESRSEDQYATITMNRARGTHLLEPMKAIVQELITAGRSVNEISKQLGMKPEEIYRLSDFSRDDFLRVMQKGSKGYSRAYEIKKT